MTHFFSKTASFIARQSGRPITFILASVVIIAWAALGPLFKYSDTWQLIINTGTTIVTFLMVLLSRTRRTGMEPLYRQSWMN
jgi:low affinity Fe/Cu permease